MGKSFGIHKALDIISIIPAILGLCMFFFIKEKQAPRQISATEPSWKDIRQIDSRLKLYLIVAFLFTLGNSSNSCLLLKAKTTGFDDINVVLLYFIYKIIAAVLSIPLGKLSDKVGRKKLLVAGYIVFAKYGRR